MESDSWRMPEALTPSLLPGASDRLRMVYADVSPESRAAARTTIRGLADSMEYNLAEYSDFETATAELQAALKQRLALLLAVGAIMALVATMSLMGAMAASVNERRREFAMLRSVGGTPAQLRTTVLLEAALLGMAGGIAGLAGGVILGAGALVGLDLPLGEVRPPWALAGASLVAALAMALVAAVGPARRIMRVSPVEAVRAE